MEMTPASSLTDASASSFRIVLYARDSWHVSRSPRSGPASPCSYCVSHGHRIFLPELEPQTAPRRIPKPSDTLRQPFPEPYLCSKAIRVSYLVLPWEPFRRSLC